MRYRIKFIKDGQLIRQTSLRFCDWNSAKFFLAKILKYPYSELTYSWEKHGIKAEIVCPNGIPF